MRFARSAAESAEQDLKKARNALHEPLRAFGQAVAESSISHSAECAAFLEKIALARKEMADLDLEIEALAKTAEAKKGGAKRFALVWGTTALVVVVLLFLFLRSCFSGSGVSGNMSPAQTIETGARAISNGQPAAIWAMMPASYQKEIEGMVAGFANAMDEELWNKGLATLAKAQKTLEAKSGLIAESMGGALGAQSGMTSKQWQASLDQAAKVLKQALDSRIFELKSLKKPDIAEWIDDFAQKAAQDTVQKIRDGKLAAGPETKEMADVLKKLATVKATVKSAEGDAATVEVQFGDKTDTVELAKVDNRWIPKDMARGFPESMKANKAAIAALPEKVKQAKPQMMMMLGGIDGMLDAVSKAKTAEEMQAAVGGAMGMMGGMRMMGGMGGM